MSSIFDKFKNAVFTIGVWGVILWGFNFACGLIVQNRYIAVDPINEKAAESTYGYFLPNQEKIILFPGLKEYKVTINSLGLRSTGYRGDLSPGNLQDKYKILAVGDSVTFGIYADDEDTYPYRLQKILADQGKETVVLNAGVGGSSITDVLYYLKIKGLKLRPNLAIISFCDNDFYGLDDEPVYERLKKKRIDSFMTTFKLAKFMRIFRKMELAVRYRRSNNKIKDARVREALNKDSKDPEDSFYVAAHESGITVLDPRHEDLKTNWEKYFKVLDETIDLLRTDGIEVLFIMHPHVLTVFDRVKDDYHDILIAHLKEKKVDYVDLRPSFKAKGPAALDLYVHPPRDFHLNGPGNQILAEEIYRKIKHKIR